MNKAEQIFYNYLVKKQGINPKDIKKSKSDSPDFIVNQNKNIKGYEVKLLRGKRITFYPKQLLKMKQKNIEQEIVIIKYGKKIPIKIIPLEKLKNIPYQNFEGFKIISMENKENIIFFKLEVPTEIWEEFKKTMDKSCTINEVLIEMIKKRIKENEFK